MGELTGGQRLGSAISSEPKLFALDHVTDFRIIRWKGSWPYETVCVCDSSRNLERVADEMGATPIRYFSEIPGFVSSRRSEKRDKAARLQREVLCPRAESLWKRWSEGRNSQDLALAELIRYLNRYAKRYPKYQQQSRRQKLLQSLIYQAKDEWLMRHSDCIVDAVLVQSFHNSWVDWNELHLMATATGEWQDEDDYTYSESQYLYAYVLLVEGQEFRFHSFKKLQGDCPKKEEAIGRAEPLPDSEIILNDVQAIAAAFWQMQLPIPLKFLRDSKRSGRLSSSLFANA